MGRRSGLRDRDRATRYRQGKVSLGGGLTGLMVSLSATFIFSLLAGAVLQGQGHDLHKVVKGNTAWASAGAGTAFVLAVFLSFLWGGYTAGRMGGGAGVANGVLVPGIALLALAAAGGSAVLQGMERFTFPFGIGSLPLDANLTPLGIAVTAGAAVSMLAGGIWGGVIGARWHLRLNDELYAGYETAGTDSFTDLMGRPTP